MVSGETRVQTEEAQRSHSVFMNHMRRRVACTDQPEIPSGMKDGE